jgi:CheY-like chemotaxis protein
MEPVLQDEPKTILVVDDDPCIVAVIFALLADSEYNVLTAGSGPKALEQSRAYEGDIHLLLSDFQMPVMSGIELATEMTADRPQLKVLLMSGFNGGVLILNEGWHFLAKPFMASQLRALIMGLLFPDKKSPKFSKPLTTERRKPANVFEVQTLSLRSSGPDTGRKRHGE